MYPHTGSGPACCWGVPPEHLRAPCERRSCARFAARATIAPNPRTHFNIMLNGAQRPHRLSPNRRNGVRSVAGSRVRRGNSMKRWVRLLAFLTILLALTAAACGTGEGGDADGGSSADDSGGDDVVKAAWIYIGPRNDGGWTQAHDEGRLMVEEELGDQVETAYLENVPEEPAAATRAIEGFARDGYDIIFTTSFGYMDPTLEVAEKYPDIKFEHCSGFKTADNMSNYFGAMEEASYLAGMAA